MNAAPKLDPRLASTGEPTTRVVPLIPKRAPSREAGKEVTLTAFAIEQEVDVADEQPYTAKTVAMSDCKAVKTIVVPDIDSPTMAEPKEPAVFVDSSTLRISLQDFDATELQP